jgi:CRISPR system Cascade subunit CasE
VPEPIGDRLNLVEMRPDLERLVAAIRPYGLPEGCEADWGYTVHVWLAAVFGPHAPKPWRLWVDRYRRGRLVGYASLDATGLRDYARRFADPHVSGVVDLDRWGLASRPIPRWEAGARLAFEVLCCPVGRQSETGVEKDLFLLMADHAPRAVLSREAIYGAWVAAQLQEREAAVVDEVALVTWSVVRHIRQGRTPEGTRVPRWIRRTQALLRGTLTVRDPDAFAAMLARGVGRHRAFGYGCLLVRAPHD